MSKLNTRKSIGGMRRGSLLNVGKNTKTEKSEFFFSSHGYSIASDITEEGEYFAEIKEFREGDRNFIVLAPFTEETGERMFFENVFIYIEKTNSLSSSAGQFLKLFEKARHLGDIEGRIIGIEVKLNEGTSGRVFKNVVRVFKTEKDSLIFYDAHMRSKTSGTGSQETSISIDKKLQEPVDEDDDEDDSLFNDGQSDTFSDEIFDREDADDDEIEEE